MRRKREKRITLLLCILLLITAAAFLAVLKSEQEDDTYYSEQHNSTNTTTEYAATNLTAGELLDRITVGYNIGNSLDCCPNTGQNDGTYDTSYYETYWSNPVITKDFIRVVHTNGFNAIRLPVTWYYNTYKDNGQLKIREEWLNRVTEVIDYALEYNFYVILDSHHDESLIWADMEDIDKVSDNVEALWSQISEHFKDYDERLVFESFNEINTKDNSWQYNEAAISATNILNQLFVDTVRASGGKNTDRILICDTYLSESTDDILNGFVLPKDEAVDKLAISIHSYNPSYNQDIRSFFEKLQKHSKRFRVPIVITEFGTKDSFVPAEYRPNHAGNYIACANEYDIKCFWWDDGNYFKLFDRESCTLLHEDIVESLMNPAEFKTNKVSTSIFDSIQSYSFAAVSAATGELKDYPDGALTLNPGKQGFPTVYGYGYRINLNATGNADGIRLAGLCFYDAHQNFVQFIALDNELSYDVAPPEGASFMRIFFYNPWGARTLDEYISYFEKGELSLEITEYEK